MTSPGLGGDRSARASQTSATPAVAATTQGSASGNSGGSSGTAVAVLDEFKAQLLNLQGNQS